MNNKPAIIFVIALKQEIPDALKFIPTTTTKALLANDTRNISKGPYLCIISGVGKHNALKTMQWIHKHMYPDIIINIGSCGSTKKDPTEFGLKVSVIKDGCSGNSYTMDLGSVSEAKANGDKIFTHNGAHVIVEKLSYMFVIGSMVDYQETLLASGFQLVNPNIKRSCSCGSSFAV